MRMCPVIMLVGLLPSLISVKIKGPVSFLRAAFSPPPPPRSRMALHIISLLLFLLNPTSSLRTPLPMFMTHPPVFSHQVNLEILYRRYWKQKELKQSNCEVCSCLPCVPDFSTKVSTHTVSLYLSVLPQWNRLLPSFREESGSTRGQAAGQGRLWRP